MRNRKRYIYAVIIFLLTVGLLQACKTTQYGYKDRESIEWEDIWIPHGNEGNLPRVLLVGNSITKAYYPDVTQQLEGKAYVAKFATSYFLTDPILLKHLAALLDNYHFDVIHFNNGMHGWQHTEQEYDEGFKAYLKVIRQHAPHAHLIWANTTPLKVSPDAVPGAPEATDERIEDRNRIGLHYIQQAAIAVDDLFSLAKGHPEYHTDNVHFNQAACKIQAAQVAEKIQDALKKN